MAGTSAGAAKGWITRRRGGFSMTSEGVIMPRPRGQAAQPRREQAPMPVAIRHDNTHEINYAASLDVKHLTRIYGTHQLEAVLSQFRSRERIDEAARSVGLRRRSGETNAGLIRRIVEHEKGGAAPRATPAPRPAPAPKSSTPVRGQRVQRATPPAPRLGAAGVLAGMPAPIVPEHPPRTEHEYADRRRRMVDRLRNGAWDFPRDQRAYARLQGELRGLDAAVPHDWLIGQTHS